MEELEEEDEKKEEAAEPVQEDSTPQMSTFQQREPRLGALAEGGGPSESI